MNPNDPNNFLNVPNYPNSQNHPNSQNYPNSQDYPYSQNYPNSPNYPYSPNYPNSQNYSYPQPFVTSPNYPNSQHQQNSEYCVNAEFSPNEDNISSSDEAQPSKKKKVGVKTPWRASEDMALMSAWILVSENAVRGKNQKKAIIWNKIEINYDAAQEENPDAIGERNLNQMKGRWKRLNENASKWVSACREAVRRKRSGMSQTDLERDAHTIYEETNRSKFTDLVVFNEVMCKHPKWDPVAPDYGVKHGRSEPVDDSNEESGGSSKRSRTTEDGEYANPNDPDTPASGCSTISRPIGRDKAKKKGKCKASSSYDQMAASIGKLALTRELENETNKIRLEVEREKMQRKTLKMNQVLLNSLLNKPNLTPAEEELKVKLINSLFG